MNSETKFEELRSENKILSLELNYDAIVQAMSSLEEDYEVWGLLEDAYDDLYDELVELELQRQGLEEAMEKEYDERGMDLEEKLYLREETSSYEESTSGSDQYAGSGSDMEIEEDYSLESYSDSDSDSDYIP